MSDEQDLRRLAEAANGDRPAGTSGPWPGPQTDEFWNFVAACSPAAILSLLDDRDRLAAEVARLRAELERAAYAFHSAHLGWEGPCCCPAHKIASEALEPK